MNYLTHLILSILLALGVTHTSPALPPASVVSLVAPIVTVAPTATPTSKAVQHAILPSQTLQEAPQVEIAPVLTPAEPPQVFTTPSGAVIGSDGSVLYQPPQEVAPAPQQPEQTPSQPEWSQYPYVAPTTPAPYLPQAGTIVPPKDPSRADCAYTMSGHGFGSPLWYRCQALFGNQ